jgi:hypothetical protein
VIARSAEFFSEFPEQLALFGALLASRRHEHGQLKVERCRPLQKSVLLGPGCKVFDGVTMMADGHCKRSASSQLVEVA